MNGTMGTILVNVLPFVVVLAVFYFLMIIPEKKRKKQYQAMIEGLRVHDEIVTKGGIVGKITNIEEKYVTVETSNAKTKIKFEKSAVAYKTGKDANL
ncbi:preprotein translocase subunit YajC [uncultured Clostridium sp.]|uniref:preprotein translocase subunit YajC n=1 Tax=uncultured Clostridium sp. TaxID=59620 RepID=UPI0025CD7AFB|nr:preprotein translocase subunit YajC [uncultured Clostridium sp.]